MKFSGRGAERKKMATTQTARIREHVPGISPRTRNGKGAAARLARWEPLETFHISSLDLRLKAERLYLLARTTGEGADRRFKEAIELQVGTLGFGLADINIWGRLLQCFAGKNNPQASARLLTSLGSLLCASPQMGVNPDQRRAETVRFLGDLLFAYDASIINDLLSRQADPLMVSVVEARAGINLRQVVALLRAENVDPGFARALLARLRGSQTYDALAAKLPPEVLARIAPPATAP
ncbi:MAG: hypothetical protein JW873_07120 [Candidatus Saganbacteria bacterium]|nr:hypothetical protein [Candidatus Saganbacteria bacterium]